jgi:hypothetical protein
MKLAAAAGLLLLGMAAQGPVHAADYPYSGFFALALPDANSADTQLSCANGFFRQDRDGSFVNYHLDAETYDRDGTIRYVQYSRGICRLLDDGQIEWCRMTFSTEPEEIWSVYVDVIRSIGPDAIAVAFFDDVEKARAFLAGTAPPTDSSAFVRCAGFTDQTLGAALTAEESRLSPEDRSALLSPDLDAAARARMMTILDRLLRTPQP